MATGLGKRLLNRLPGGTPTPPPGRTVAAPAARAQPRSAAAPGKGGTVVTAAPAKAAARKAPVKAPAKAASVAKGAPVKAAKVVKAGKVAAPAKAVVKAVVKAAPAKKAPAKAAPAKKAPAKKAPAPAKAAAPAPAPAPAALPPAVPTPATETVPAKATKAAARQAKPVLAVIPSGPLTGADAWTKTELKAIGKELEEQARELSGEIDTAEVASESLKRDQSSEGSGDEADAGTKTFEREHEMSLANNSRDLLVQVERALGRLAAGTYGRCENCGTPIPKARLQAFPRATLCVTCKQREERR